MNTSPTASPLSDWSARLAAELAAAGPCPASAPTACVIGSGPAGLQAAASLRMQGCSVTIREAAPRPGISLLRTPAGDGTSTCREIIPPMTEAELQALLQAFENAGIVILCGKPAGQAGFEALSSAFDAVVFACGRGAVFPADANGHLAGNVHAVGACVKNGKTCTALEAIAAASALGKHLAPALAASKNFGN